MRTLVLCLLMAVGLALAHAGAARAATPDAPLVVCVSVAECQSAPILAPPSGPPLALAALHHDGARLPGSVARASLEVPPIAGDAGAATIAPAPASTDETLKTAGDAWGAFHAGRWAYGCALALMLALMLVRRLAPSLFEGDMRGTVTALSTAFLGALVTGLSTGAPLGWNMLQSAFTVGVLAVGGYSVIWKRLVRPLMEWARGKFA